MEERTKTILITAMTYFWSRIPKCISLKWNIIAQVELEISYYEAAVYRLIHVDPLINYH